METATFVRKQVEAEKQVNSAIAKDLIRIIQSAEPEKMNQLIGSLAGREYNLTAVLVEVACYLPKGKKLAEIEAKLGNVGKKRISKQPEENNGRSKLINKKLIHTFCFMALTVYIGIASFITYNVGVDYLILFGLFITLLIIFLIVAGFTRLLFGPL